MKVNSTVILERATFDINSFLAVLIDPHKRAIYDCLGKKGLQEQGWEIVQRTKTPREIREEYEQLAR